MTAPSVPTLHLISGLPCSGKTTYARALAERTGATMFCLDQWLISLFTKYSINKVGRTEHVRRVLACRERMWEAAETILRLGGEVIFDDGFFYREHRMQAVERARGFGAQTTIHYLSASNERIKSRLDARNAQLPEFNFFIESSLVDEFAKLYQPPSEDEGAQIVRVMAE